MSDYCLSFLFCPSDDRCNTGEFYIEVASPSWFASGMRAVPEFDVDKFLKVYSEPGRVVLCWRNGGGRSYRVGYLLWRESPRGLVSVPAEEFHAEFARVGSAQCAWEAVAYRVLPIQQLEKDGFPNIFEVSLSFREGLAQFLRFWACTGVLHTFPGTGVPLPPTPRRGWCL